MAGIGERDRLGTRRHLVAREHGDTLGRGQHLRIEAELQGQRAIELHQPRCGDRRRRQPGIETLRQPRIAVVERQARQRVHVLVASLLVVARRGDAAHAVVVKRDVLQGAEIEVTPHDRWAAIGERDPEVAHAPVGRCPVGHFAGFAGPDTRRSHEIRSPHVELGRRHGKLGNRILRRILQPEGGFLGGGLPREKDQGGDGQRAHHGQNNLTANDGLRTSLSQIAEAR